MLDRIIQAKIKKLAKVFPVVSVMGPRQSGKTTLVKNVFSGYKYVNLENLDERLFAENDPKNFLLQNSKNGVIIDEAQKVPQLFSYLQNIADDSKKMGQYVLTGSQNFLISESISQSLAGRVATFNLFPFSLEEIIKTKYKMKEKNDYLFHGFYPPVYDRKIKPVDFYPRYIQTYIERDVRLIKNIGNLSLFQKFIKLCAGRAGQLLNFASLGNDCGIDQKTAKSWLSILEAGYIVYLLQPHHENFNKRLVKQAKLYFYDTGLLCSLLNIEKTSQIDSHYMSGAIFENFVISEFIKYQYHTGKIPRVFFFRDHVGNEIDLLIEKGDGKILVEIKAGTTINEDYFKTLNLYDSLSKDKKNQYFLVYGGEKNHILNKINILSWDSILQILR